MAQLDINNLVGTLEIRPQETTGEIEARLLREEREHFYGQIKGLVLFVVVLLTFMSYGR